MRYMVIVEKGPTSYGAHVPDLPGCIAVGESREEVLSLIREAISLHIDGLKEQDLPVPEPTSGDFWYEDPAPVPHEALQPLRARHALPRASRIGHQAKGTRIE